MEFEQEPKQGLELYVAVCLDANDGDRRKEATGEKSEDNWNGHLANRKRRQMGAKRRDVLACRRATDSKKQ